MALGHAILGTILYEPKTGYDLARLFEADAFFWRAAHQQIYRELARLESDGLIAPAAGEPGPRGDRKRAITEAGRNRLAEWAGTPAEPATIKEDLLVKCLTLGLVPRGDLADQLVTRRQQHLGRLRRHEETAAREFPQDATLNDRQLGRFLALSGGIAYERAWLDWADSAIRLLASPSAQSLDGTKNRP